MLDNELNDDFVAVMNKLEQKLFSEISCCAVGRIELGFNDVFLETSGYAYRVLLLIFPCPC
jgi:hypothetical protein